MNLLLLKLQDDSFANCASHFYLTNFTLGSWSDFEFLVFFLTIMLLTTLMTSLPICYSSFYNNSQHFEVKMHWLIVVNVITNTNFHYILTSAVIAGTNRVVLSSLISTRRTQGTSTSTVQILSGHADWNAITTNFYRYQKVKINSCLFCTVKQLNWLTKDNYKHYKWSIATYI